MARTVIHEDTSGPAYVDSTGPGVGVVLGVLLAVVAIALLVLFLVGALRTGSSSHTNYTPFTGGGGNGGASAQPSSMPSAQGNPTP